MTAAVAPVSSPDSPDWGRRNLRLLAVFAPVLIATGLLGLLLPPRLSLLSAAPPYDLFHIAFGVLGLAIAIGRSGRLAALFNLGFGAIDLFQAVAGTVGFFPAELFALGPSDHLAHVIVGALLIAFGLHRPRRADPSRLR